MEKRLSDAAMEGDIQSLQDLLQEDPLILHRSIVSCVSETPLHVSSMLGHVNFVQELLNLNPELASELDSHGCSALHLAAAKGHLEIVKELVRVDPEMCMVRNQDGKTPLHLAAIKGRVKVVRELVRGRPESAQVVTERDETALHLCVGSNRLLGLKSLVEEIGKDDDVLVNQKDCDGNTVLHIAVAKKQIEITKFLLTVPGLDINAINKNGFTVLDTLTQSPRDLRDMEIECILGDAGVLSAKDLQIIAPEWVLNPTKVPQTTMSLVSRVSAEESNSRMPIQKHKHTDWLGRKRSALMVVASLIATVAFQAAITPPGGVWQADENVDGNGNPLEHPRKAGTAVMAYSQDIEYGQFMIFNTLAFLASLSIILLLVSGLPMKRRRWMWIQMIIMWVAITAQVITYFISLRHMSPDSAAGMLRDVTEISVLAWLCLMGVVFIGNVIRMNLWVLRKYGFIKEKEQKPSAQVDNDQEDV
ncbi:ankyrin repeat-containing protein At5g02620-like [Herrania umbratica]|uniref:Ankyrin repeat-containing protein At5g02620-like n=1 Tax=Herrania umbratica TaxID=108875 RepID=A0A6J0ZR33_9ROSI|nr:ankyrin repeat-containing protein At5g02620-like [Herrania umbratica]